MTFAPTRWSVEESRGCLLTRNWAEKMCRIRSRCQPIRWHWCSRPRRRSLATRRCCRPGMNRIRYWTSAGVETREDESVDTCKINDVFDSVSRLNQLHTDVYRASKPLFSDLYPISLQKKSCSSKRHWGHSIVQLIFFIIGYNFKMNQILFEIFHFGI